MTEPRNDLRACRAAPSFPDNTKALTTLGDPGDDAIVLDIIGVVGLDVSGKTVESALDSFLGG